MKVISEVPKEEPAPHVDAGFFRQVDGERSMYLSR